MMNARVKRIGVATGAAFLGLLALAWAVPALIDLDSRKPAIALALGEALGRPVRIDGPITLHLLPRPAVSAGQLVIDEGRAGIDRLEFRLDLRALLSFAIRPASISVQGGRAGAIKDVQAAIDLGAEPAGRGTFRLAGMPLSFTVAAGAAGDDASRKVTAALSHENDGARIDFSGRLDGAGSLDGRLILRVDPARVLGLIAPDGAGLEGEANLALDGAGMTLDGLALRLGEARASGSLTALFGDAPAVDAELVVSGLDLDGWRRLEGTAPREVSAVPAPANPPSPGAPPSPAEIAIGTAAGMSVAATESPAGLLANLAIRAEALTWRGLAISDVQAEFTHFGGIAQLRRAGATLPGGSRLDLKGVLADNAFDGWVQARSANAPVLLSWLGLPAPLKSFAIAGRLLAGPEVVEAKNLALTLNSLQARGDLTLNLGGGGLKGVALTLVDPGGASVQASGTVSGSAYDLALSARHPSVVQALRHVVPDYAPRANPGALSLQARLKGDKTGASLEGIEMAAGSLRLAGQARIALAGRPRIDADLVGNAMILDPFLPAPRKGAVLVPLPGALKAAPAFALPRNARSVAVAASGPWSRSPLGLEALSAFDARLGFKAESLSYLGWMLEHPEATLAVADGTLVLEPFKGRLLGGDFALTAKMNAGGLAGRLHLAGADAGRAGLEGAGLAVTRGQLDAEAQWTARGQSPQSLAESLAGNGRLLVKDGLISGFDLAAINRRSAAIENIGNLFALFEAGLAGGNTRFSRLAGTFKAEAGVVNSQDIVLEAESGGGNAQGRIDIGRWTIDARAGFKLADAQAPPLVVRLEGPLSSPRKILDANALQHYLVAKGLGRALQGKSGSGQGGGNSGRDILKDLLRGLGR